MRVVIYLLTRVLWITSLLSRVAEVLNETPTDFNETFVEKNIKLGPKQKLGSVFYRKLCIQKSFPITKQRNVFYTVRIRTER